MQSQHIGISWQLSDRHGWGIFGLNLALNLIENGPLPPLLVSDPHFIGLSDAIADRLRSHFQPPPLSKSTLTTSTLLHSLGNQFRENPKTQTLRGRKNIAICFFEESHFGPPEISRATAWDLLLVGSSWNRNLCLANKIPNVTFVSQGVDTGLFSPAQKQGVPSGRFIIFSGGKLEYRKGQDQVLSAFKIFHERHPDSLLVTAWQNSWIPSAQSIGESPLIQTAPEADANGTLNLTAWARDNGIPPTAFVDLGWVSNSRMPAVLNEVDVAVFASRCEGGTNLVAMEAMACGVPCILSHNTGHLDIIDRQENCYPLLRQSTAGDGARRDWCNSDIDEIVSCLEQAYLDSADRRRRGRQAALSMAALSWENQTAALIAKILPYL